MIIEREIIKNAMTQALVMHVGMGKENSTAALAVDTGVPEDNIKAYRRGDMLPSWYYACQILANMPPAFAMTALAPTGLLVQPAPDNAIEIKELAVSWAGSLHKHTVNMLDGKYSESEERNMHPYILQANLESARCLNYLNKKLGIA